MLELLVGMYVYLALDHFVLCTETWSSFLFLLVTGSRGLWAPG